MSSFEAKFDRRCCWWGCGTPGQVSVLEQRNTYFCNTDKCNGPGSEAILGYFSEYLEKIDESTYHFIYLRISTENDKHDDNIDHHYHYDYYHYGANYGCSNNHINDDTNNYHNTDNDNNNDNNNNNVNDNNNDDDAKTDLPVLRLLREQFAAMQLDRTELSHVHALSQ